MVVAKGRLGPGQMVLADLAAGTFALNTEIARTVATKHPYKEWLSRSGRLEGLGASKSFLPAPSMSSADALKLQAANGVISNPWEGPMQDDKIFVRMERTQFLFLRNAIISHHMIQMIICAARIIRRAIYPLTFDFRSITTPSVKCCKSYAVRAVNDALCTNALLFSRIADATVSIILHYCSATRG